MHILIIFSGNFLLSDKHYLTVDGTIVGNVSGPVAAIQYVFALFYVLNIQYPKEVGCTLEFIQR